MAERIKRRRTLSPKPRGKAGNVWNEVLRVWSTLLRFPMLKDSSDNKCNRFVIFCGQFNETVVTTSQISSEGQHSEMYSVEMNGLAQPAILKRFLSTTEENVPPMVEARLQQYAHEHGFAPRVLACNKYGMISERCEHTLSRDSLPDGYKWLNGLPRMTVRQLNVVNKALGFGYQKVLNISRQMYEKIGMYNMDPNIDNYMFLKDKLVQIDYGMNRFKNVESFRQWADHFPKDNLHEFVNILVPSRQATYPPDYHWYQTFVSMGESDKSHWCLSDWKSYHMQMHMQRTILISQLEASSLQILTKKIVASEIPRYESACFKMHCLRV